MTPVQYAKSRGISHQAVYKALRDGRLKRLPDGTIAPASAAADEATSAVHREPLAAPSTGSIPQSTSMAQAKLASEVLKVKRQRLDLEMREKKLVSVEEVSRIWFTKVRGVRDQFLNLPNRVTAKLVAVAQSESSYNAQIAVRTLLEQEIRDVLEELSNEPSQSGNVAAE